MLEQSGSAKTIARMDACLQTLKNSQISNDEALERSIAKCAKLVDLVTSIRTVTDKSSLLAIQSIDNFIETPWDEVHSIAIAEKIENLVKNVCLLSLTISNIASHISSFEHIPEIERLILDLEKTSEQAFDFMQSQSSTTNNRGE